MNSTIGTLATLRRLYHHLNNGGAWHYGADMQTLSWAISTIEELSEGACRYNCRTAKANWLAGHWYANGQPAWDDVAYNAEAEKHYKTWRNSNA